MGHKARRRLTLAAASVLGLGSAVSCTADGPDETVDGPATLASDANAFTLSAPLPACFQGMTTELVEVDPDPSKRCTVAMLTDLLTYQCSAGAGTAVCDFLLHQVEPTGATIQCTSYVVGNQARYCADTVDRYADGEAVERDPHGNAQSFFAVYTTDSPGEWAYGSWETAKTDPHYLAPPVSLGAMGYVPEGHTKTAQPSPPDPHDREERIFFADPRMCPDCGEYAGPNIDEIINPAELSYWTPYFGGYGSHPGACSFETLSSGTSTLLSGSDCEAEAVYRTTGR